MLHGWMDASPSFQFVVDALRREWHVIAPDWRGFGLSEGGEDCYWFPDYLGDLDAILDLRGGEEPVRLVGHSMGGNVASLYAGVCPARVSQLVAMDAFGLADRFPDEAPGRYQKWLNQLGRPQSFASYDDHAALAARLQAENPRLSAPRAAFLARALGAEDETGCIRRAGDPAHRRINPVLYRRAEAMACWRRVTAPVLYLLPEDAALRRKLGISDAEDIAGKACFRDFRELVMADAGHNMHHDQPAAVAAAIETFFEQ